MALDVIKESWFWSLISSILLFLSILFIWRQLRIQGYAHNLQSMFALNSRWNSHEMTLARKEVCAHHLSNGQWNRPEEFVAMFFEDLGNYVVQGALPMRFVWSQYSYEVEHYWPMFEKEIRQIRHDRHDKTLYINFEKLHKRCKWYSRWENRWSFSALPVDIDDFIKSETQKLDYYSDIRQGNKIILPQARSRG
jgi:hypothetical protein